MEEAGVRAVRAHRILQATIVTVTGAMLIALAGALGGSLPPAPQATHSQQGEQR
jgi:hypothetical protein